MEEEEEEEEGEEEEYLKRAPPHLRSPGSKGTPPPYPDCEANRRAPTGLSH